MVKQTPLEAICRLPASFYGGGSKSFAQLVRESRIGEPGSGATVEAIAAVLRRVPALVEGWLLWSDNKRVSSGWYFKRDGNTWIVGHFPRGEELRFDDVVLGCAEFILREIGLAHAL